MRTQRIVALAVVIPLAFALGALAASSDIKGIESDLKKALEAKDFGALDRAIQALRTAGGEDAVKLLVRTAQKMPQGEDLLYWRLLNGAAGMADEAGLSAVASAVLSGETPPLVARDLMFAMQNNRAPKAPLLVHAKVLEKGAQDLQLMAADQLALIETADSVDVLIAALKREEKKEGELRRRILNSLKSLTAADCGAAANWEKWWAGARADGPQGRKKREQQEATGTVVDEGFRGPETEALSKIKPEMILVLKAGAPKGKQDRGNCNFDRIEEILDQMKIPHEVATIEDFNEGKVGLEGRMALILNCAQIFDHCICPTCHPGGGGAGNRMSRCTGCNKHDTVNHRLSGLTYKTDPTTGKQKQDPISGNVKRVKEWVERGGYVFSEDYWLTGLLEPCWPQYVKAGKQIKQRTVTCSPARGRATHPMLRGVFIDPAAAAANAPGEGGETALRDPNQLPPGAKITRNWVIDDDSPVIEVTGGANVVLLLTSEELKAEGPNREAVALTFLPSAPATEKFAGEGKPEKLQGGRVLHVLSHFGKQEAKEDEFALQNLLLNFLIEGNRRFPKGVK
jgi:hypothetical protein